jgi:hypothetical protein
LRKNRNKITSSSRLFWSTEQIDSVAPFEKVCQPSWNKRHIFLWELQASQSTVYTLEQ